MHLFVFPSQFDSVADISDVSSSVTLKSYTMHFEVPLCAAWTPAYLLHAVLSVQWEAEVFTDGTIKSETPGVSVSWDLL